MAAGGYRRGVRARGTLAAARDGIRAAGRDAAGDGHLRDDGADGRLCAGRTVADLGCRARQRSGSVGRRGAPVDGIQSRTVRRTGQPACALGRWCLRCRWVGASGISDRTALEAGARWLHERACADHPREPDPEAARLFNPSAHAARRASSHNRRHRPGEPDQPGHRRGRANSHPRHPPRQTETSRHPGGGRALDISRIATRPLRPRGRSASERSTNAFRAGSGRT